MHSSDLDIFACLPVAAVIFSEREHRANPAAVALLGERLPTLLQGMRDMHLISRCREAAVEQRLPFDGMMLHLQARAMGEGVLCTITDQTARASLERDEVISKTAGRMGQIGGWEMDLLTQRPVWSDEVCRIHGVPPGYQPTLEEAISAYAPEARPLVQKAVDQALAGGTGWDLELPFLGFDGRPRWVRAIGQVLIEDGVVSRVFGAFQDITIKKEAELALRESLKRTRLHEKLFAGLNVCLAIASTDGFFLELNETWERLLGYSSEELRSRPFLSFVHPDDVAPTVAEVGRLKDPRYETLSFVNRYRKKDGGWVSLRWNASSDATGECIYAVAHDITAELETQRQLKQLAMIASRTDNSVLVTDAQGRAVWANDAFTRISGYSLAELLGRKPGSLLQGPESDSEAIKRMGAAIRRGEPFTTELINYHRDGHPYWISIEVQPLRDEAGELTGFMAIESDITEQKKARQDLIAARDAAEAAAAAAEEATRAKSAFLAMMSHELRTPMNGILGTAQLLARTSLTREQEEYVDIIRASGDGLLAVLNDILDFSKIEAGRMELSEAPFSLRRCLQQVTALYTHSATQRGLALRLECCPSLPPQVLGDELRLRQVISNLVGNALKFTDHGAVTVRARLDGERIHISVQDTGVGIAAADQGALFQAFHQIDASAQRRFQGTGLGLAICERLVSLMGGQIGVESALGEGSTFWLSVRLPETERPQILPEPVDLVRLSGMSVLLVEDNPINRLVARRMLEALGCVVSLAGDGEEAITVLSRETFSLVLMDCHMPVLDGWGATQALRARGCQVPIVALTASVMPEEIARCRRSGMDDYLSKPLELPQLQQILQRWGALEPVQRPA